mmetsp:Transcript_8617/g.18667  ORF Transcript_8617/g.18667 Transcript_8617/m.18667 type:complete len:83 (-) Transcript_8617:72-320(-)
MVLGVSNLQRRRTMGRAFVAVDLRGDVLNYYGTWMEIGHKGPFGRASFCEVDFTAGCCTTTTGADVRNATVLHTEWREMFGA